MKCILMYIVKLLQINHVLTYLTALFVRLNN